MKRSVRQTEPRQPSDTFQNSRSAAGKDVAGDENLHSRSVGCGFSSFMSNSQVKCPPDVQLDMKVRFEACADSLGGHSTRCSMVVSR